MSKTALIVGAGRGLSAELARALSRDGYGCILAARNIEKLAALCSETGALAFRCDVSSDPDVAALFAELDARSITPTVVIYNPSARVRGPIADVAPAEVFRAVDITAFGGFRVAQQAARRMLKAGGGTIVFTGASASIKGFAQSAAFAMGKFALRGLAQSMARELGPQGIHVAHVVIDGGIRSAARPVPVEAPDSLLDPAAIAETCMQLIRQPRSAWSMEVELRPWSERF
jgi:NAD(P)-dependent dehydrogenase (short-subunit alcohol dehydrogenase family)